MKIYKLGLQNKCTYAIPSKSNNGKVVKYTGIIFWGGISQGGGKCGGRISKKKKKTYKFPSKNESMYEISSKSDNGKVVKNRGNNLGGGRRISRWKMEKFTFLNGEWSKWRNLLF